MSNRFNYSKNGVIHIDNFRERVNRNNFPRIPIGIIGGIDEWYITIRRRQLNDGNYLYPIICVNRKPTLRARFYFNILKADGSSEFTVELGGIMAPEKCPIGDLMYIGDLFHENFGLLNDDKLTVEYGFQIDAILSPERIWKFNFYDNLFGKDSIHFYERKPDDDGYCLPQLFIFQSSEFAGLREIQTFYPMESYDDFDDVLFPVLHDVLQFAHGVRIKLDFVAILGILNLAHDYKLTNLTRAIDHLLVRDEDEEFDLQNAISCNLNCFLSAILRGLKSRKELAKELKKIDDDSFDRMSGEAMKKCAKFIFEN